MAELKRTAVKPEDLNLLSTGDMGALFNGGEPGPASDFFQPQTEVVSSKPKISPVEKVSKARRPAHLKVPFSGQYGRHIKFVEGVSTTPVPLEIEDELVNIYGKDHVTRVED